MAIGNPFGLGGSVTLGIVSARDRDIQSGPYDDFIQTDAAINQGNSGGPLFDMDGKVVGINTAIIARGGSSLGIGFAVPVNLARPVVAQLAEYGETRRGWLGVGIQEVSPEIWRPASSRKTQPEWCAGGRRHQDRTGRWRAARRVTSSSNSTASHDRQDADLPRLRRRNRGGQQGAGRRCCARASEMIARRHAWPARDRRADHRGAGTAECADRR